MPQKSSVTGGKPQIWQKPAKPKKPESVFPTYESNAGLRGKGGASGAPLTRVYPAPPDDPMLGIGDLLLRGLSGNQEPSANPLADIVNQVNAGTGSGGAGGSQRVTGGNAGGNAGVVAGGAAGAQTGAYNPITGETYSYQDRFGGSATNYTDAYTPAGLNEMNQSNNYDVLIAAMLAELGITNPELIKQLSTHANSFGGLIDLIAGGDPSSGASVGFIGDYINQMMTPGGAVPTFDELTNMLLGDTGTAAAGSIQQNAGVNDINNYILDLLDSVGGNQYYQRAMYGALDSNQREYNADRYKGNQQGTYAEYLRQNGLYG